MPTRLLKAWLVLDENGEPCCDSVLSVNGRIARTGWGLHDPSAETVTAGENAIITPGVVDSHMHIAGLTLQRSGVDLRGSKSSVEVAKRLARARGGIAYGRGWSEEEFENEKDRLTRKLLDEHIPGRPAVAVRVCGHMAVANTAALSIARSWERYPGLVDRNRGILLEDAVSYTIEKLLGEAPPTGGIRSTLQALHETGIQAVSSMSCTPWEARGLRMIESQSGGLPVKVSCYPDYDRLLGDGWEAPLRGRDWSIVGVKLYADGSLGARTAFLSEPYEDKPGTRGLQLLDRESLERRIAEATGKGLRVAVHAIGDAAIETVAEAYASACGVPRACRIEHASLPSTASIRAFRAVQAGVAVQPRFRVSDWWAARRLGARRSHMLYPLRLLHRALEGLVSYSTDSPVEPFEPWKTVRAALGVDCGRLESCSPGWNVSLGSAINAYTVVAALNSGGPASLLGRLEKGSPARLTGWTIDGGGLPVDSWPVNL